MAFHGDSSVHAEDLAALPAIGTGLRRRGAASDRAIRLVTETLFFVVLPALLLYSFLASKGVAFDFRAFWQSGRDILEGQSPYVNATFGDFKNALDATSGYENRFGFVYPAPTLLALAPLGWLPFGAAAALFSAVLVASLAAALRILGVRDWRCYGATFLWFPTLFAVKLGTLTPLLVLGLALVWRYRDDRRIVVLATAATVVAKLFLWPLLVWLLATRRVASAVWATIVGVAATAAAWAVIGFDSFLDYPRLVDRLAAAVQSEAYSPVSLGLALGLSPTAARLCAVALGAGLLVAIVALGRRPGGDRAALAAAVAAALVFTPIVWNHYFALLLVPVAIARPRLSPLWFLPALVWTGPESDGAVWNIALTMAVAGLALVLAGRSSQAAGAGAATAEAT